jgi:hypothetical protein
VSVPEVFFHRSAFFISEATFCLERRKAMRSVNPFLVDCELKLFASEEVPPLFIEAVYTPVDIDSMESPALIESVSVGEFAKPPQTLVLWTRFLMMLTMFVFLLIACVR